MTIKGIRHTGIVVQDLPSSIEYWKELGFTVQRINVELGAYTDKLMGLSGSDVTTAKLTAPDGSMVELLCIPSHKEISGITHIAMSVADIEHTKYLLNLRGHYPKFDIVASPDGRVKVAYIHAPDGVILELVEELC